jgi:hypothetical protein
MREGLPTSGPENPANPVVASVETGMRDSRFQIPYPEMTVRRKVTSSHFVLFVK